MNNKYVIIFLRDKMKKVFTVILSLLIIYLLYVGIDYFRLKNDVGLKPLITLDESITENEERYTGLGYVVTYDLDCTQEDDVRLCKIISSEYSFLVFLNGKIFMNKENLWKQL